MVFFQLGKSQEKHSIQVGIVYFSTAYLIIYNYFLCLIVWLLFISFFQQKAWSFEPPEIKQLAMFTNYENGFWLKFSVGRLKFQISA